MVTNVLVLMCGFVSLFITIDTVMKEKGNHIKYIVMMGVFTFLWCVGFAQMGMASRFSVAYKWRAVGLTGVIFFLVAETAFFAHESKINKNVQTIVHGIFFLYGFFDLIFFSNHRVDLFARVNGRVCYYSQKAWERTFHEFFIAIIFFTLFFIGIKWYREVTFRREKHYVKLLFGANMFLLASSLMDTFIPLLGRPSWPSSTFGATLTFAFVVYISTQYNAFHIAEDNLREYFFLYSDIGVMAFDQDRQLVLANPYAKKTIGFPDVRGRLLISKLLECDSGEENYIFSEIASGQEITRVFKSRLNGRRCSLSFKAAYDSSGLIYAYIATVNDLSREDEMMNELSRADAAKSDFLANMSHEIRTPVNAVLGMNEMILRENTQPRVREYAENIDSSCNLLLSIINDILDFSKIGSGDIELSNSRFSLSSVIHSLVVMTENRAKKKQINFKVVVDETLPAYLYGDEMRVRQIITNLLTNAVKYTDYGTIIFEISKNNAGSFEDTDIISLKIDVKDTGRGIKEEDINNLFEAFKRVDEGRNKGIEGTGLGLSIASHFVHLMGGKIGVESEYGKGSDFYVVLPLKVASYEKIGNYNQNSSVYGNAGSRNEGSFIAPDARVLVVDDNGINLEVAKLLLKRTQINIDTAESGMMALEMMREKEYDLVLLDHMMPIMDGMEVLEIMKKEGIKGDIPVIALTANAVSGAREMYLGKGFDDYISKPIEGEKIEEILRKWLPKEMIQNKEVQK